MKTTALGMALGLACVQPALAHFPFILPLSPGQARLVFSETLEADPGVDQGLLGAGSFWVGQGNGIFIDSASSAGEQGWHLGWESGPQAENLLYGSLDLGLNQRGSGPAHVLVYYPKALVGDPFAEDGLLGSRVPIELIPRRADGGLCLQLLVDSQPLTQAPLTLLLPDGSTRELLTDDQGLTESFASPGRYGVWARHWLEESGERDGQSYEQIRRYATLVFDVPAGIGADPNKDQVTGAAPNRSNGANSAHGQRSASAPFFETRTLEQRLPEATSSFGAVALDGWLYVYGGHIAPTHDYHTAAVSGRFYRIDLSLQTDWESLTEGPALQGLNLAVHSGLIYRIGGMQPQNLPDEPVDNLSLTEAARYDPAKRLWEALPGLPQARSSHDLVVLGENLYVIGGWNLRGKQDIEWCESMLRLDLTQSQPTWTVLAQPFKRRALIAAAHQDRLYVLGGFDAESVPSRRVDIYDPRSGRWSQGPGLPGEPLNGFSPAACVHDRRLYISVGDGGLFRLNDQENLWEQVAETTPRIVHRLVPHGERILVLGGATGGDNLDLLEAVSIASPLQESGLRPAAQISRPPSRQAAAAAADVQKFCPVMKEEPVDSESIAVEYAGQTVLLCCENCRRRFQADPARYADPLWLAHLRSEPQ